MRKFLSFLLILMFASPSLHALACSQVVSDAVNSEAATRPSCHGPAQQKEVPGQNTSPESDFVEARNAGCPLCGAKLCEDRDLLIQSTVKSPDLQSYELSLSFVQIFGNQERLVAKIRPPPSHLARAFVVTDLLNSQSFRGVYLN